ncbi:MAG: hypothetical protein NVS9B10_15140 [Nevskia sp.]
MKNDYLRPIYEGFRDSIILSIRIIAAIAATVSAFASHANTQAPKLGVGPIGMQAEPDTKDARRM